jgi:hypothetical protein
MYTAPINDLEAQGLQQGVENAHQEAPVKSRILDRVCASVQRRAESFVEVQGNHTEHLLKRSHEHRPYLSIHPFLEVCSLELTCSFT